MRINIVGAGPAGLYAAILLKRTRPDLDISILEQNPADATFGFGVVFSDQALDFLRADDPETTDLIEPAMERWSDIVVAHKSERVVIDGIGFAGIGRLALLRLLRERATQLGITPRYNHRIEDIAALARSDLIIGADGLNSIVRRGDPGAFGERIEMLENRFIWYGTNRNYDALTQTFIDTPFGPMTAHHYSYAPGRSTFIIEMGRETIIRSGFANREEPLYRAECEALFSEALDGSRLIPNNSQWRQFPNLRCDMWHAGNRVLVGDALHTAHFSIGSGTRLALEDVIALVRALRDTDWDVSKALPTYQTIREPVLGKIVEAARQSALWYERFPDHMALDPRPFALSYIRRAGRLDPKRLERLSPAFAAELRDHGVALEAA